MGAFLFCICIGDLSIGLVVGTKGKNLSMLAKLHILKLGCKRRLSLFYIIQAQQRILHISVAKSNPPAGAIPKYRVKTGRHQPVALPINNAPSACIRKPIFGVLSFFSLIFLLLKANNLHGIALFQHQLGPSL